jgi:hypothetical protein
MNDSSRSRKMCISGFITAPMREQARYVSVNCHQLGSWQATTSLRPTPRRRQADGDAVGHRRPVSR